MSNPPYKCEHKTCSLTTNEKVLDYGYTFP
jgi:hypothetical protein